MKKILSWFLAFAFLAASAHAIDKPRTIVTKDGSTYHNATIISHDANQAMVACDEGTVFIKLDNLPADIQSELGYLGPGVAEKQAAEKAAAEKAQAEKEAQEKQQKLESSKHEYLPGSEKERYPRLNPDFFPDELASEIDAYNSKAQYTAILAGGTQSPETTQTINANAAVLKTLHANYLEYKAFIQNPPQGTDVNAARKAVTDGDYKPYPGEPEIVAKAIMGIPDKMDAPPVDGAGVKRIYYYGKSQLLFVDGKYVGDPRYLPKKQ